jgi:hypothetical protein
MLLEYDRSRIVADPTSYEYSIVFAGTVAAVRVFTEPPEVAEIVIRVGEIISLT